MLKMGRVPLFTLFTSASGVNGQGQIYHIILSGCLASNANSQDKDNYFFANQCLDLITINMFVKYSNEVNF